MLSMSPYDTRPSSGTVLLLVQAQNVEFAGDITDSGGSYENPCQVSCTLKILFHVNFLLLYAT